MGFNKRSLVYHCDLGSYTLVTAFTRWCDPPGRLQLRKWKRKWECSYFIRGKRSDNHFILEDPLPSKGLITRVEVEYVAAEKKLCVLVYTAYRTWLVLGFPLFVFAQALVQLDKSQWGLFLGILVLLLIVLALVLSLSKGEETKIRESIEQQLYYRQIHFERNKQ